MRAEDLRESLKLIVITDGPLAAARSVEEVVEKALQAGARAVQLREKRGTARSMLEKAQRLRSITREWDALFFLNDRFDVALASEADGVHLGPDDLPVAAVRAASPPGFLIGYSTDSPNTARRAQEDGADYIGCGAVYPTATKKDAGEIIGVEGLARVAQAVEVPVVGIGGVTPVGARDIAAKSGAAGTAVIGAVMSAVDVGELVRELLDPFDRT